MLEVNFANIKDVSFNGLRFLKNKKTLPNNIEKNDPDTLEKSLEGLAQSGRASLAAGHIKPKDLPFQVDLAILRTYSRENSFEARKIISNYANCYRFGNREGKDILSQDVKDNVKKYLKELDIDNIDENDIKVVIEGDSDNMGTLANRIPVYFNNKTQKTVVFTKDGLPNYQLAFETNKRGKIIDMVITDIYNLKDHIWMAK